jgi:hypothetical protein
MGVEAVVKGTTAPEVKFTTEAMVRFTMEVVMKNITEEEVERE